jgi:hypothetical protein
VDHYYTQRWNFREHVRAHREISRLSLGRWRVSALIASGFILVALTLAAVSSEDPAAVMAGGAPWLLLIIIWLTIFFFGLGWVAAWQTERSDPSVRDPMHRAVSADGLKVITSAASVELKWHGIQRIVETEEFFLFFFNKQCAYYLSKHAVGSPVDQEALRATIRARYVGRADLRPAA